MDGIRERDEFGRDSILKGSDRLYVREHVFREDGRD